MALLTRDDDVDDDDEDDDDEDDDFLMKWDSLLIFKGGDDSNPLMLLLVAEVIGFFAWNCEGLMTLVLIFEGNNYPQHTETKGEVMELVIIWVFFKWIWGGKKTKKVWNKWK